MELRKGVVAEVQDKDSVIVLTTNGDILEVKTNGKRHEIGDEILFYTRPKTNEGKWARSRALRYTAGLAAALLFFFSNPFSTSELGMDLANLMGKKDAYAASVYIESKSNVKVGVNGDQKVISVKPLNKPAKFVLKDMKWSGRPIDEFIDDYFETAKETGYLGPEDSAIIAVDPESEKDDILETIQKDVTESPFISENGIKVITVSVPNVVVEKAKALGLTPGKFSIYLAASKLGKKIPVDVVKVATVTEIVDAIPAVAKVLPTYSEETLAQLVNGVSTPSTEEAAANPSVPSEPAGSTTTTAQSAPNPSKGAQSSSVSSTDSATIVNSSDSRQQSEAQPQSQDDSSNGSSSSNNVDTPESQTQEGQSQDNQTQQQEGQPQSNQSQDSQPQQDDQTQGQTQQSDQSQSNQSPDSQSQQDTTQSNQSDQSQDSQTQDSQGNGNTTSDQQQPSVTAAISETVSGLVNKIIG